MPNEIPIIKNTDMPYQFLIKLPVDIIGQNIINKITKDIILNFLSPEFEKIKLHI